MASEKCPKCGGLVVYEPYGQESLPKCMNCGWAGPVQREAVKVVVETTAKILEAQKQDKQNCEYIVRNGSRCATLKLAGEQYCRRHLPVKANLKIQDGLADSLEIKRMELTTVQVGKEMRTFEKCSLPHCRKPRLEGSIQCLNHYNRQLRRNTKYRNKTRKALSGEFSVGAVDLDWKGNILGKLFAQRDLLKVQLKSIDDAIQSVQAIAVS